MRALALVLLVFCALPAQAVTCRDMEHEGRPYTVCEVDAAREDLRLFLSDEAGDLLGQFGAVDAALEAEGARLAFGMNAGMYHPDRSPVGLYVEEGKAQTPLVTRAGPGNFGLLPNGVFCIRQERARVYETLRFEAKRPECRDATKSGPMQVIDGALHPRFLSDSPSRYLRNGVGTSADGRRAVFAISNVPVTFHEFGRLFRDVLDTPDALYLDGNISRLHAPALGRSDPGLWVGPIVGVVERTEN